jgi:hypothetical protein
LQRLARESGDLESETPKIFSSSQLDWTEDLDFNEFKQAAMKPTAFEQWASSLPLPQLLADALPREKGPDPIKLFSSLSDDQISDVCQAFLVGLKQVLVPCFVYS